MRVTTQPLLNAWRGSLTVGATPALGDILRYQARGHDLREFLHARIAAAPGPTVLIGHSLGGIALVDLLALAAARGEAVPGTELLVTVGSQAPFLYELGALTALEPGAKLPYGFPRWLNVYDRQDVLSYLAGPVFPGDPRITDHEIGSRQPFPACHSAYWKQDALYERIEQAVAEAEIG
ncbi:alpha/beta fold hydrolase [Streptomyces virginiae]|uniref:alpha/beta fold hydrolase n=2 Tax=Streptomyces virginiae TaxID=1961 RepID=UPI00331D3C73